MKQINHKRDKCKRGYLKQRLAIFLLFALFLRGHPVYAASAQKPVQLNILLVVDQSLDGKESNVNTLGYESAVLAYSWANQLMAEDQGLSVNLGVVQFDQSPHVVTPLQPAAQVSGLQEYLITSLAVAQAALNKLMTPAPGSNYAAAIDYAAELLADVPSMAGVDQRSAIILVGNGYLSPDGASGAANVEMPLKVALQEISAQPSLGDLYLLRLPAGKEEVWTQSQASWNEFLPAQSVNQVANIQEMHQAFVNALGNTMARVGEQQKAQIGCDSYQVPPYLAEAKFVFHKSQPQLRPILIDPKGNQVPGDASAGAMDFNAVDVVNGDSNIEAVTVHNPWPGRWQVICPAAPRPSPAIYLATEAITSRFSIAEPIYRGLPVEIVFQPLGHNQAPLAAYAADLPELRVVPVITASNGHSTTFSPLLHNRSDNSYRGLITAGDAADKVTVEVTLADAVATSEAVGPPAAESLALHPSAIYYRLIGGADFTLLFGKEIAVELVDEDGGPIKVSHEAVDATHLHLSIDHGREIQMTKQANDQDDLIFSTEFTAESPGIHLLSVNLSTDVDPTAASTLAPLNSTNAAITVHMPKLRPVDEPIAALWPQPLHLTPVDENDKPLPLAAMPQLEHTLEVARKDITFPFQNRASFDAATNRYSLWVWPLAGMVTVPLQWKLRLPAHPDLVTISAQSSWPSLFPQQQPTEYARVVLDLLWQYPRQYIVAPLVVIGLVAFFALAGKRLLRIYQQRTTKGYLTLVSADNTLTESYKIGRKKEQSWFPVQRNRFRVGRVAINLKGGRKNPQLRVSVFDSQNGEDFAYWHERPLAKDETIDIGVAAQLVRTMTPYQQMDRQQTSNLAKTVQPSGKMPSAEEYFRAG